MQIRCPHCRQPIELVDDDPSGDIECSSCGSSFNLAADPEATHLTADGEETKSYEPVARTLGHYELLNCLGQGAFGSVWKARDTELDRTVAIKIPRAERMAPEDADRFLREARAAAQVRHPNIVSVHEVGREEGRIYIASDLVEGASLDEWIEAHPLSVREAVELCAKVATALHHAHDAGIVHRDLKPQNILMDMEGEPHITDFGLAKRDAGEITMTVEGAIMGTPAYMSPEQARGEAHQADRRSDVYSLGVMLFRLLTGELPFRGRSQMLIVQILKDEPPAPRKLDAKIPRDIETICLKCLEKDPSRRYQTSAALGADLERWLTGHPITARRVGRMERIWRWCCRNPLVATLSATILLVLLVATATLSGLTWWAMTEKGRADKNLTLAGRREAEANRQRSEANAAAVRERNARDDAVATLARANYFLADARWRQYRVGEALELLESVPDEHRNVEWYLARRQFEGSDMPLYGHAFVVSSVAWSPDGTRIASSSGDKTIKLWDVATGAELRTLTGHSDKVKCVVYSPDGKRLASGDYDGVIKVWDIETGAEIRTLKTQRALVESVAFSPDGTRLSAGCGTITKAWEIKVWELEKGTELHTLRGHTNIVTSVAFSPDGAQLASASYDRTVKLWDTATGSELRTLVGHPAMVHSVMFSPDGMQLASSGGDDSPTNPGEIKLWDLRTGLEERTLVGHSAKVSKVVFSPDGTQLASAGLDSTLKLWDTATGDEVRTLSGHDFGVLSVAFSPDGIRLASGGADYAVKVWNVKKKAGFHLLEGHSHVVTSAAFNSQGTKLASGSADKTIRVWDAETGAKLRTLTGQTQPVLCVAFSPDGKWLASGSGDARLEQPGDIRVFDTRSGDELHTLKGHSGGVASVVFSPYGTRLASCSGDGSTRLWDAATGGAIRSFKVDKGKILSVAFSPDGTRLAWGTGGVNSPGEIKVWDVDAGNELRTINCLSRGVRCVAFSPDGTQLASGSFDSTIKLWDTTTGAELQMLSGHKEAVQCMAFDPEGTRLVSGSSDAITVWDAETGAELRTLTGYADLVMSLGFSSDGTKLAVGAGLREKSGEIHIWDMDSKTESRTLSGHSDRIWSVSFSPDGSQMASGGKDRTIRVWDTVNWSIIRTLTGHTEAISSISFSPDSKRIASGASDKSIRIWEVATGAELRILHGHSYGVESLVFSSDGSQLYSEDFYGNQIYWDATTGKQVPEPDEWPDFASLKNRTPDGRILAVPSGRWIRLVDLAFKDIPREKARRASLARLDPRRHGREAEKAKRSVAKATETPTRARAWFSAMFHRAWQLKANPSNEDVRDQLLEAYSAWKELFEEQLRKRAQSNSDLPKVEVFLPPVVREVLNL